MDKYVFGESEKFHLLIGVTGSVATIKLGEIIQKLKQETSKALSIRVIATERSKHFVDCSTLGVPVYLDEDEWSAWSKRGDPVLHIELRRWANLLLIAPLDANTMAKMANGLCDNLLTSVIRAWDLKKPLYFCPAMNTHMYEHPLTEKQRRVLRDEFGYHEIECIEKLLMCQDRGLGAMASVETIAATVLAVINES